MTVRIFISVDMEGIGGITTVRQVTRGTDDYAWARQLMTQETNAAIAGAADAGALKIVVSDSHGDMGNILPLELDPRAELVQGTPKLPWSMMTGIEEGFTGCVFLGYHAGSGTAAAILDHTYTGWFADIRVEWTLVERDAPQRRARRYLRRPPAVRLGRRRVLQPGDRRASVGQGVLDEDRVRIDVRPIEVAEERAGCDTAPRRRVGEERRSSAQVWKPDGPFSLEALLTSSALGDMLAIAPGTERTSPRSVKFDAPDVRTMYRMLLTWMNLGRRVGPHAPVE